MNLVKRGYHFIYGLVLFVLYARRLNFNNLVKGKRIAIVGAANSAYNTEKGAFIDGFDYVIRINKAPYVVKEDKWQKDIGSRTDVLFHSFFENESSGGGPLNLPLYDSLGIKYLINPISSYAGYRVSFNFYKKYLRRRVTYLMPHKWYKEIETALGQFRPTIGFCALNAVVQADFSELYITGFTFFKTAFGEGYRDHMKESTQVRKYLQEAGLHNPDMEFVQFLKLLNSTTDKKIMLDDTLQSIIREHTN